MLWLIPIAAIALGLCARYLIQRHNVGKRAAIRDFRGALIFFAIIIVILFGLHFFPASLKVNKWMILNLIFVIAVWTHLIIWLQRKRKAGPVLLDIGRTTQHKILVVAGGFFILACIIELIDLFEPGSKTVLNVFFTGLLFLSIGITFIAYGLSHFEIREGGLLFLDSLVIKWGKIKSYQWEGTDNLTLVLSLKKGFALIRTRSFHIPAHHRETMERLLEQYLKNEKMT